MAFLREESSFGQGLKPQPLRYRLEVHAVGGVRGLHPGLAVALVVDHHDAQVGRLLHADGGERSQPHQHLAVAGDDEHPAPRLREREAEAHHRGLPHRAPQREAERRIAGGGDVPRGRAEPGNHQQLAPILEQLLYDFAPPVH
jgi:hypothetical protein